MKLPPPPRTGTPRELADGCCDHCRALPGAGPWCARCGVEMPGADVHDDTWFADLCGDCERVVTRTTDEAAL